MSGAEQWEVAVDGTARRGLRRLPAKASAAIIEFITGPLVDDPHRLSKPLHGELSASTESR